MINYLIKLKNKIMTHVDKLLHMMSCFMIQTMATAIAFRMSSLPIAIIIASSLTIGMSLFKEYLDRKDYGLWSWHDLVADAIGMVLGLATVLLLTTK